ncbi:MAG TPA: hypothetical protein V6C58_06365, partial [Allocoleopsis sp.]
PQMSRKELENMFGVEDLRKTRFAQELIEETEQIAEQRGEMRGEIKGKLKTVPRLLGKGFSLEEIADILQLDIQQVRQAINDLN